MSDPTISCRPSRRPAWAALACVLGFPVFGHPASAQEVPIPVSGRPPAGFYGAQGVGVKVAWSLDRDTVALDDDLIATLVVTNVNNSRAVTRPDLKSLPKFHSQFVISDMPDPPAGPKEVRFAYRLRPRDLAVKEIPRLDFCYHNPTAAAGKDFPLTQTQRNLAIAVTPPKPKPAAPAVPLREPEHLFAVARGESVLGGPPFEPCAWAWTAAWFAGPLAAVAWFLVWRRVFPDAARLARIRRSHAARRARHAIRHANRTPDPPAALAGAVLGYLRSHFLLPPGAATPTEVGVALAELGRSAAEREEVVAFLRACDAARFAPTGGSDTALTGTAESLVSRLEVA